MKGPRQTSSRRRSPQLLRRSAPACRRADKYRRRPRNVGDIRGRDACRNEFPGREDVRIGNANAGAIEKERQLLLYQHKNPEDPNIVVLVRGDALARWRTDVERVIEQWQDGGFVNFALRAKQEVD